MITLILAKNVMLVSICNLTFYLNSNQCLDYNGTHNNQEKKRLNETNLAACEVSPTSTILNSYVGICS